MVFIVLFFFFFFQAEDGIRDHCVTGVQTCALPILVDDGDAVGELVGLFQVLGGQQHGGAGVDQVADQVPEVPAAGRVQPGGGLVQEQHLRAADQAGGQVEAAPHADRVGLDLPVGGRS